MKETNGKDTDYKTGYLFGLGLGIFSMAATLGASIVFCINWLSAKLGGVNVLGRAVETTGEGDYSVFMVAAVWLLFTVVLAWWLTGRLVRHMEATGRW